MDRSVLEIVRDVLLKEKTRIDQSLREIELELAGTNSRKKSRFSPEGLKAISQATKKRWAQKKAQATVVPVPVKKALSAAQLRAMRENAVKARKAAAARAKAARKKR